MTLGRDPGDCRAPFYGDHSPVLPCPLSENSCALYFSSFLIVSSRKASLLPVTLSRLEEKSHSLVLTNLCLRRQSEGENSISKTWMITCVLELLTGLGQGSYRTFVKYSGMMFNMQIPRPPTKLGPGGVHESQQAPWMIVLQTEVWQPWCSTSKARTQDRRGKALCGKFCLISFQRGLKQSLEVRNSVYPLRLVKSIWASLVLQHFSLLSCVPLLTSSCIFARYFSLALLTKLLATSPPTNHSQWVLPFCSQNLFSQICT